MMQISSRLSKCRLYSNVIPVLLPECDVIISHLGRMYFPFSSCIYNCVPVSFILLLIETSLFLPTAVSNVSFNDGTDSDNLCRRFFIVLLYVIVLYDGKL